MNPSRLLKTSTSGSASVLNLQMAPLGALTIALEEDLESQARASLSLFGFGVHDAVNWSLVAAGDSVSAASAMAGSSGVNGGNGYSNGTGNGTTTTTSSSSAHGNGNGNGNSTSGVGGGAVGVTLLERVCPIGTNAFLWNTMNMGESGASAMSAMSGDPSDTASGGMNPSGEDDPDWDPLGYGHIFASKILQQYLVKCVALIPASVEEVVDLLIRSDRDDMETPMHHLVGVKMTASGVIYRRKRKRTRRAKHPRRALNTTNGNGSSNGNGNSNSNSNNNSNGSISSSSRRQRTLTPPQSQSHSHSPTDLSDSSSSDSEEEEEVVVIDDNSENQSLNDLNRPTTANARYHLRSTASTASMDSNASERPTVNMNIPNSHSSSSSSLFSSYMDEYRASLTQGQQGNLSLKWVVGEKTGRMFTQRANYCLLDYECVLVNDWEEEANGGRPMYVRALQSVYLPQCQPWIDELGAKPTDLQPTGIMVREATQRPGFVEVQFVASILEKAQLPMTSRRAKLRALCAKIARLEEVVTSRRLSQSLLAHQPHWVSNRERQVCHCCDAVFKTLTRRRHHCRLCGEICCSDCCPKKDVALPEVGTTSVRVCVFCVQKRRHSGDAVESSSVSVSSSSATGATLSPVAKSGASSASSLYYMATPPPHQSHSHHHLTLQHSLSSSSSSSPSEYYLSSSSYGGSMPGSFSGTGGTSGSLGDRKPSLASSMFQKFKSSSLGN